MGNKGGDRTATSANGTSLSVRDTGDGPPMVLVHGVLDDAIALMAKGLAGERDRSAAYPRAGGS